MRPPEPSVSYARLRDSIAGRSLPLALVDLDAFEQNLDSLLKEARAHRKQIRIASKSVRCVELLRRAHERAGENISGIMAFTVEEAAHLVDHGFSNILVAYPTVQDADADRLVDLNSRKDVCVSLVVDCVQQLGPLEARSGTGKIPIVAEVDLSLRPLGRAAHIGARRSPLRDPEQILNLVRAIESHPHLRFAGLMGYESQVAGLTDRNPFTRMMNPVKAMIRRSSVPRVRKHREEIAEYLRNQGCTWELFNGGGTASLRSTAAEPAVTEATIGSGLLCGHLFDYYSDLQLRPAAYFALQAVRRPSPRFITCLGGGYVASGQPGPDRLPLPVFPAGLELTDFEAAGEVQTPLVVPDGVEISLGDPVFFRHAKSGELAEHFDSYLLVRGAKVEGIVPTYRGEGKTFL